MSGMLFRLCLVCVCVLQLELKCWQSASLSEELRCIGAHVIIFLQIVPLTFLQVVVRQTLGGSQSTALHLVCRSRCKKQSRKRLNKVELDVRGNAPCCEHCALRTQLSYCIRVAAASSIPTQTLWTLHHW